MNVFRSLKLIFNYKTLIISILSVTSTYLCYYYNFFADFPLTLLGIAVVFPIVFSINSAYNRRENALENYANLKAHSRSMFFAVRDWVPNSDKQFQYRFKNKLYNLLIDCRIMFNSDHTDDVHREAVIYENFSKMSKFIEECRERGMSPGEVSRTNQYLSKMLYAFENMKHIYEYRTPVTLRAYSKIFIFTLPIVYGPYFAKLSLHMPYFMLFFVPVLLSFILVSLDNIQDQLENPFDLIGEDDVKINVGRFLNRLEVK
jgi:predicted membrane chloride channel (bestrophin family)